MSRESAESQRNKLKRNQRISDAYKRIFGDPENEDAKLILNDLVRKYFVNRPANVIVSGCPQSTGYRLGQRSIVDYILNQVVSNEDALIKQLIQHREEL